MKMESTAETRNISKLIVDFIANIPLFDDLDIPDLKLLADRMSLVELEADQILFDEWEKGDSVCFVESGTMEVLKKSGGNAYAAIATLGRGRSIGEMAIIENFPRSVTLKALTKARVVTFSRQDFGYIMKNHPNVGISVLKSLARLLGHNLRKASSRMADYLMPMG
jgi:CRP/FNR family transcriptional regulator, cyclic AMP receptor protein